MVLKMFCFNNEVRLEAVDKNTNRKVLAHGEHMMGVEVHFAKATTHVELHSHVHEQLTYIVKGAFKFIIGEEAKVVKQGDTIFMPSNVSHGCIVLEEDSVLFDVFTPQRQDFLK